MVRDVSLDDFDFLFGIAFVIVRELHGIVPVLIAGTETLGQITAVAEGFPATYGTARVVSYRGYLHDASGY